jgi:hypothetical protein
MENKYITCNKCGVEKGLDNFYFNGGYYIHKCKGCYKEEYNERRKNVPTLQNKVIIDNGKIRCKVCDEEKLLCEFHITKGKYYNRTCKKCNYNKFKKVKEITEDEKLFKEGYKVCRVCNETLPVNRFSTKNSTKYTKSTCDSCKNQKKRNSESYLNYQKKWINSEKGKLSKKISKIKYRQKIKEENRIKREEKIKQKELLDIEKNRIKEELRIERENKKELKLIKKEEWMKKMEYYSSDEWKEIKKQKDKEKHYERWKNRWENDELFAIKVRLRNLIRNSFRKKGYVKFNMKTESIVGVDYNGFKEYMESKFSEGMSWDNRGDWHIDHIIPLSSARSQEELIKLSHYTNLQPLWAEDNMKKGDKIL